MGISLQSALMIQGNEVSVETYSDKTKTRYGFIVYLMKREDIHTKIVSTLPHFPYENVEMAESAGVDLVGAVKKMDLNPQISGLQKALGSNNCKTSSEIIQKSK